MSCDDDGWPTFASTSKVGLELIFGGDLFRPSEPLTRDIACTLKYVESTFCIPKTICL